MSKSKIIFNAFLVTLLVVFTSMNSASDDILINKKNNFKSEKFGHFEAIVDGDKVIFKYPEAVIVKHYNGNTVLEISATDSYAEKSIDFKILNASIGSFELLPKTGNSRSGVYINRVGKKISAGTRYRGSSGILVIDEYDIENNKISGTFEFKAYNSRSDKFVKITKGLFKDVSLKYY